MQERPLETNRVTISGEVVSDFELSHEKCGEKFYTAELSTERVSGTADIIPITVSDRLIDVKADWKGRYLKIYGQFRSYNKHTENGSHLNLSVFVRDFMPDEFENGEPGIEHDENYIYLDGCICKEPKHRKTPLGREITDILLAVNRPYRKSDYIPCIAWGRNARFAGNLEVGTHIQIEGRIQSREYQKKIFDDEYETRVAYEVSASAIKVIEDKEMEDNEDERRN